MYDLAGITLCGMYNYFNIAKEKGQTETDLFENIELYPGGEAWDQTIPEIDKEILIETILEEYGECLTYRQIPDRFKKMCDIFFKKNYENFKKIWIAYSLNYNPIYNYDRIEDSTDKTTYNSNMTKTGSELTDYNGKEKTENSRSGSTTDTPSGLASKVDTTTNGNGVTVTENEISADNSSAYSPESRQTVTTQVTPGTVKETLTQISGSGTHTETEINEKTLVGRSDLHTFNSVKDSHGGNDQAKHDAHIYGNIGVTTSAQMVKEIKEVYSNNIYDYIADLFARELLLIIY